MLIMLGFPFQWPTLPTLVMFPILVTMYVRLAHREERDVLAEFGEPYARYAKVTPAFFAKAFQTGEQVIRLWATSFLSSWYKHRSSSNSANWSSECDAIVNHASVALCAEYQKE